VGWELQGLSSYTVPVFMWSDKEIFLNAQVYDTITTGDVEFALASLLHKDTSKTSKLSSSINQNVAAPEVVILFVEPELRTDQVPYLSSAFASSPAGGSFSHIKKALENAGSSLVMPYAAVDDVSLLDEVLLDTFESINNANIFMANVAGSTLFSRLRRLNGVKLVNLDSLMTEMKSAHAFDNGVTDLVVVSFGDNDFSEHDEIVGSVLANIRAASKGNYAAIYTANVPVASKLTWSFERHARSEFQDTIQYIMADDINGSNSSNITTHHLVNYFPGPFIEVLLVCSILITMLFTGGCAIFSLQTPDKWEAPKVKREL